MSADTRKSWVAFDETGFPFGFSIERPNMKTIAQAAKEFPGASRIELLDTDEWKAQLDRHRSTRQS